MNKIFSIFFLLLIAGQLQAQKTLGYYLETARVNSPLANDNENKAKVSELEAERLSAVYNRPKIDLNGNFLFAPILSTENNKTRFEANSNGSTDYYGYDLSSTNGGLYQGVAKLTQPLFNGGKAFEKQAEIIAEVNRNMAKLNIHDLEKLVTDQYILCLKDKNQIAFVDSMLKLLDNQTNLVKKLVDNALLKPSDLSLVNIEQKNYRGLRTTFKANYRSDLMDLNVLSGIKDTTLVELEKIDLSVPPRETNNAFLEKYRLDSLNLLAGQEVFEAKYKPQLNFVADAGLNTTYAPDIPNRFGLSAGLNFTWNLFDGRQKSIVQNKTDIQLQTVSFYRENFLKKNGVRKNKLLNELKSYEDRMAIAEAQLEEYDNLLTNFRKEILYGQLSIIDYITTLKNRNMVERDFILLKTNRLLLINAYNYWNW
ncbi:hypothetical protein JoomaDRAFT_2331 [Galbibacter orientalis DSM 19592]|uniref:Outer membrane protein n=1 Tax=Galbibacter orientalis DSM 19592 TaxID=926559 RepID=I3C6S4_9FLAO|nr:TolC family protein [Galbibacter orientalis]EIJ39317.1 hypothetical protein JoomaDRAFT_2331 [Galbibacter orientalis DSM 19592]